MSTYQQTLQYLYTQLPMFSVMGAGAYKPGLDTALTLSAAFGDPHRIYPTVHVAGTNGKGSTSHTIASVLMASGLKVGLFTSPHMFDFRERIRVNGHMISEESVVDFVDRYRAMELEASPSFFELTTIMAMEHFARCRVDVAVIEVGLGGRLDTTNIITPVLSVITNISMDHMAQLGDTPAAVAAEKAGIIKAGVPVVIGESTDDVRRVFADKARQMCAPIVYADDTPVSHIVVDGRDYYSRHAGEAPTYECDLRGPFQPLNINTVMHALDLLPWVTDDGVRRGLANVQSATGLMGRWMTIREGHPRIVIDTGHNIGAWQHIAPTLERLAADGDLRMVLGFVEDKDVEPIFDLLPRRATYYFVTPPTHRGRPAAQLLSMARDRGLGASAYDSVVEGMSRAIADSPEDGLIFVGGSNYIYTELARVPILRDSLETIMHP